MQAGRLEILLAKPRIDERLHRFASERVVRFGTHRREYQATALVFELARIINVQGGYVEFDFTMEYVTRRATVGPEDYIIVRIDPSFYRSNDRLCIDCGQLGESWGVGINEESGLPEEMFSCTQCFNVWYIPRESNGATFAHYYLAPPRRRFPPVILGLVAGTTNSVVLPPPPFPQEPS